MNARWKPERYTEVSPYLISDDAQRVIDFIGDVFDGKVLRRYDAPAGGILHAEVRIGDSVVMLADSAPEWPPIRSHVHVYVADVDAVFERAVRVGAGEAQKPARREGDPDRRGGVVDPAGNTWWLATQAQEEGGT